jgi:hypothetical protein
MGGVDGRKLGAALGESLGAVVGRKLRASLGESLGAVVRRKLGASLRESEGLEQSMGRGGGGVAQSAFSPFLQPTVWHESSPLQQLSSEDPKDVLWYPR